VEYRTLGEVVSGKISYITGICRKKGTEFHETHIEFQTLVDWHHA
jgi:hypothetical protein